MKELWEKESQETRTYQGAVNLKIDLLRWFLTNTGTVNKFEMCF